MGNLVVLISFILLVCIKGFDGCLEDERKALLGLKKYFVELAYDDGDHSDSLLPSWINDPQSDCCLWERVTCNSTTGHVIELSLDKLIQFGEVPSVNWNQISLFQSFEQIRILNLSSNNLLDWNTTAGYSSFSRLHWLETLDLSYNWLSNSTFKSLSALTSLEYLSLRSNLFEGSITNQDLKAFGKLRKLKYVDLSYNNFNKDIMKFLRAFPSLTSVDLSYNDMEGTLIGNELDGLSNLKIFNLGYNQLNGTLPFEGSFENLKILDLTGNDLGGSIAPHIGALSSLKKLSLSSNRLQNYLPTTISGLCQLKRLQELDLSDNSLEGNLPPCLINNLTSLKVLDLSWNNFNGSISSDPMPSSLQELHLSNNHLQGNLLPILNNLTSLKVLDLSSNNFNGTISSDLMSSSLQELDLSNNHLQGNLPPCLNNLTSLKLLDLSNNQFNGTISFYLMTSLTSLEYLDLSENSFEGISFNSTAYNSKLKVLILGWDGDKQQNLHINTSGNTLFQLEVLGLSNCNLESIPTFLYSQNQLKAVDLSHNKLKGKFPAWLLGSNAQLGALNVRNNSFAGSFYLPPHFMRNIVYLDISNNHFEGQFPEEIFPNLEYLNFSYNSFEGVLPSSIGGLKNLEQLDLSFNKFTGEVPKELTANCTKLNGLTLSNNNLTGEIFSADSNFSNLWSLKLNNNHFTGSLSNANFKMLEELEILDVSNNNMTGKIPTSFANNIGWLRVLNMKNNNFEGRFPCGQGLWEIEVVDLSHNFFSGPLPFCFNEYSRVVNLEGNRFTGSIPVALFNATNLQMLNLRNNRLSGSIPELVAIPNIRILLLGNNNLSGLIPNQLCELSNISLMDLSNNSFSGSIPSCFYNISFGSIDDSNLLPDTIFLFRRFISINSKNYRQKGVSFPLNGLFEQQLEIYFTAKYLLMHYKGGILNFMSGLDLSCNNLTGRIPWSIGDLSSIHALNLSHNHLTGSIPKSFSNLSQIESLDLSFNNLSGDIPLGLTRLNFLGAFSVSHNNLSGKIPYVEHLTTFDESSYEGNLFLCGKPVAKNCSSDVDDQPLQSPTATSAESEGKWYEVDLISFLGSLATTYIMFLLGFVTILYINPYWRRRWFIFIEDFIDSCHDYVFRIFY